MIMANHPFSRRSLNVRDENGLERCSVCSRPRGVHPPAEPPPPAPVIPDLTR